MGNLKTTKIIRNHSIRPIRPRQHLGFKVKKEAVTPVETTVVKLSHVEEVISRGGSFRELREAYGYTQKEVVLMGKGRFSQGALSKLEAGETYGPRMTTMYQIAKVYGITLDDCVALLINIHKFRYLA
jgi:DNA-binding XRE family transcriptional regulator